MSGQHARFAPSAAPEYAYCSGSILANESVPDRETQETREGDAAHWVVAGCLTAWKNGGSESSDGYLGNTAPNGVVIDEEILDSANVMIADVVEVCTRHNARAWLKVEYRVQILAVHPTDSWGTLDAALITPSLDIIYVWDFKHGHGQVDALDNFQLVSYTEGLREEWQADGYVNGNTAVHMRVVQPRCYRSSGPVDEWVTPLGQIRGHVNQLAAQAREAENNPQMCAGKHCRYCPARVPCAAAKQAGYQWVDYAKSPYQIETYDDASLATEQKILEGGLVLLKARLEAIEDELQYRISQGATGTGLVLESGLGRRKWRVPIEQAIAFCQQFGIDIEVPAARTPTQATQRVPVAMRDNFKLALDSVSERKSTGLKLVTASNSRTARAFKRSE